MVDYRKPTPNHPKCKRCGYERVEHGPTLTCPTSSPIVKLTRNGDTVTIRTES